MRKIGFEFWKLYFSLPLYWRNEIKLWKSRINKNKQRDNEFCF